MRKTLLPWLVWGLGAILFFSEYFGRVAPSVMVPELMHDFTVGALTLGSLSAAFYYIYVFMQLPVGMMVDRYGPRSLLATTAMICALGCYLFAHSRAINIAIVGRFMMGFGASFAFVGTLKLATAWFPAKRFGLLAGLTQALGMLGAAFGQTSIAFSVSAIGWRYTMSIIATIFLLLGFLIALIVRNQPSKQMIYTSVTKPKLSMLTSLKIVLKNPQTWFNALFVALFYAPTASFAEMWGASFLGTAYHLDMHKAAIASSLMFIGWGIGGPCVGWLSDKIERRKPIMFITALLCFFVMSTIIYVPHLPRIILYALLLSFGIFNAGVGTSYALSSEINPRATAGTSMAFANMSSVIIGASFQPLIGWFLQIGPQTATQSSSTFSLTNFQHALAVLPVCLFLSLLVSFLIKETFCKPIEYRVESEGPSTAEAV